jgi:hypothetical protein
VAVSDDNATAPPSPIAPTAPVPPTEIPTAPVPEAAPPAATPQVHSAPTEPPAKPVTGKTATRVENITLTSSNDQRSVYLIRLNGSLGADRLNLFQADEPPPRLVLDIVGIGEKFNRSSMKVNDQRVRSLRFGVHRNPDKLRVVWDLKHAAINETFEIDGRNVRIILSR